MARSSAKKTKPPSTPKKATTSKRATPKTKLPYGGPENPELDGQGRIRQWSSTCKDGRDLKIYVEHDCTDNLPPSLLREKFPQFKKYNPSTFSSALQNCRKTMNAQNMNCRQVNCKCVFFSIFNFHFLVLTNLLISLLILLQSVA